MSDPSENGPLWIPDPGRLKDVARTFLCVMLVQAGVWWKKAAAVYEGPKNGQSRDVLPPVSVVLLKKFRKNETDLYNN